MNHSIEAWRAKERTGREDQPVFSEHARPPQGFNPLGTVHGGWFATLLDSALAVPCRPFSTGPSRVPGKHYSTRGLNLTFRFADDPCRSSSGLYHQPVLPIRGRRGARPASEGPDERVAFLKAQ